MLDPPTDLAAEEIAACVGEYWGLDVAEVAYMPVGHGSRNWLVRERNGSRWFVKADRIGQASEHQDAAYDTAACLQESGLDVVHAAVRDRVGALRRSAARHWTVGVFPFLAGCNPDFADDSQRARIAAAVGRMHAHRPIPEMVWHWVPRVGQSGLRHLLAHQLDRPWDSGPFGDPARTLLLSCRDGIRELLDFYENCLKQLLAAEEPWTVTHGEPHGGNTLCDDTGAVHLIDCDDIMLAPKERDLWLLLSVGHQRPLAVDNRQVLAQYHQHAGSIPPRQAVLDLFRADWHLREISSYAHDFSQPHDDTADLRAHWNSLNAYLPVAQNWPS